MVLDRGESRLSGLTHAIDCVHLEKGESGRFIRWPPDDRHLLFPKSRHGVRSVEIDSGDKPLIRTTTEGRLHDAVVQPEGTHVAFTCVAGAGTELWVLEDFLPGDPEE